MLLTLHLEVDLLLEQADMLSCSTKKVNVPRVKVVLGVSRRLYSLFLSDRLFYCLSCLLCFVSQHSFSAYNKCSGLL